jgi:hypothetical protein
MLHGPAFLANENGLNAIEADMVQGTAKTGSTMCTLSQGHM